MLLTNELQEKLKTLCDGKTKIVIKGFNDLGDPFETKGRIAKDGNGEGAVYSQGLFLEFIDKYTQLKNKWTAPYFAEIGDVDSVGTNLIIGSIELEGGEVLFENADAEKYLAEAKARKEKYISTANEEGRLITKYELVSKTLLGLLGRPISFDDYDGDICGVLTELPRYADDKGYAIIKMINGTDVKTFYVGASDALDVVDLDADEKNYVCANCFMEYGTSCKYIEQRRKSIEKSAKKRGVYEELDMFSVDL